MSRHSGELEAPATSSPSQPIVSPRSLGLAVIALGLCAMYGYHGFFARVVPGYRTGWFGFDRAWHLGPWAAILLLALPFATWVMAARRSGLSSVSDRAERWLFASPLHLATTGVLASVVFYLLRNNFLNPDGRGLAAKFARDVPRLGFHATHDEMWELYIHSRFWWHTHGWFGWSVPFSYQILSAVAGGVFLVLLLLFCHRVAAGLAIPMVLCVVSGGFMQLFFGDVENYSLTAAALMGYFVAAQLYVEGRSRLLLPSTILAVAMCLHLLAGFLLPALAFLAWIEIRRGHWLGVCTSALTFIGIVSASLLFFHLHGLPIDQLYHRSQAFGYGGPFLDMLVKPSWKYYWQMGNLTLLLAPLVVFSVPLLAAKRLTGDRTDAHLGAAALGMLVLLCFWDAKLGVYDDWNLYANAVVPLSLLLSRTVVRMRTDRLAWWAIATGVAAGAFHSYAWIVTNHFHFPQP